MIGWILDDQFQEFYKLVEIHCYSKFPTAKLYTSIDYIKHFLQDHMIKIAVPELTELIKHADELVQGSDNFAMR